MSCEVGPTGLSRLMTPIIGAGELPLAFGENLGPRLDDWRRHGAAGRSGMTTTTKDRCDRHRVGHGSGPDADPGRGWAVLLEEQDDVRLAGQAQQVDEPSDASRVAPVSASMASVSEAWTTRPAAANSTPARILPHTAIVVFGLSA